MTGIFGRDRELDTLDQALDSALGSAERHVLVVVRGGDGIGKSALLGAAEGRWRDRGVPVLPVGYADEVPEWDQFGVSALVATVTRHFEEFGDPALADSLDAVRRLCVPETYESSQPRSSLLFELARLFTRLARDGSLVVLADDVDALASPAFALAPACRPGCLVVAAAGDGSAHLELEPVADGVIDLDVLPDDCVGPLLTKLVGAPLDEGDLAAIRCALGPLGRHPGTLVSTVEHFRREGQLAVVHGRACLAADVTIMVPPDHSLIAHIGPFGSNGRHLMALAATCARFTVDDLPTLAATTRRDLAGYGPAVDHLVGLGALECGQHGRLTCPSPALADRLIADAGPRITLLHSAIVRHLVTLDESAVDQTTLADHVALGGILVEPRPYYADLLETHADRLRESDPTRAARYLRSALHHLDIRGPRRRRMLRDLARLLVRIGRADLLAETLAAEPLDDEFAATATVAALYMSRPVPDDIAAAMPEAAAFAQRWYSGALLTGPADLSWCNALPTRPVAPDAETAQAIELMDLASLLQARIGVGAVAGDAPLALHNRVVRHYHDGNWKAALSAMRRLELCAPRDLASLPIARLLAAEICAARGDLRRAGDWFAAAGTDRRFVALAGWVEAGMRWREGDPDAAFELGWQAYRSAEPGLPGVARLLARLAVITAAGGRRDRAAQVLAALEKSRDQGGRQTLLLVRGVVDRDAATVRAAADVARSQGHQTELLTACLAAGELADEAGPWLREAHDIARQLGSPFAQTRVRALMQDRGVVAPKASTRRTGLSQTEVRITELIRDGRTNRQIAVALRVSEKNVEYHLSRLFAKTGSRTRVDLAAAAVRGTLDPISA
ncbi:helix-turn-helix transcriptional regulator [Actinophytocola oryzae]|uniref:Regulatory LuxR family protein n=1 Tax=Actinophytocola oryzae TaxID=502181 RepID=A0A4R7UP18_9PSEU|nr:LuxR family transcriptional regulator [Actinophytocola oryzae]TDV34588.1 regulatory LuxR family protein [Actinophytocola oryzae]